MIDRNSGWGLKDAEDGIGRWWWRISLKMWRETVSPVWLHMLDEVKPACRVPLLRHFRGQTKVGQSVAPWICLPQASHAELQASRLMNPLGPFPASTFKLPCHPATMRILEGWFTLLHGSSLFYPLFLWLICNDFGPEYAFTKRRLVAELPAHSCYHWIQVMLAAIGIFGSTQHSC